MTNFKKTSRTSRKSITIDLPVIPESTKDLHVFESGAVRNPLGIRYDLLPAGPLFSYMNYPALQKGEPVLGELHLREPQIIPPIQIATTLPMIPKKGKQAATETIMFLQFALGCLIHRERSGKYSLNPSYHAIQAYAEAMTEGSGKYGDYNWLKGIPEQNLIQHTVNHLILFEEGNNSEDHLGHAFWNISAILYFHGASQANNLAKWLSNQDYPL